VITEDKQIQQEAAYQEQLDQLDNTPVDDWEDLTEQTKAKVISKLIKSDYGAIVADTQKLFAQEMKTGNLDAQDLRFCNKVFQTISLMRGFQCRFSLKEDTSIKEFIKQLLIEVYSRIGLSNSKGGMFIDLLFKNISEKSYNYDTKKGFNAKSLLRRN